MDNGLWELALQRAPRLMLDEREPFLPVRVGVSFAKRTGPSPSFRRTLNVAEERIAAVVEYAIYYDFDIQHGYDLEHVWMYIGHDGRTVDAECSFHGRVLRALTPDRGNVTEDQCVKLYVQPGKHAMSPMAELFSLLPDVETSCGESAGTGGVLEPELFRGAFGLTPEASEAVQQYLYDHRFAPAFAYEEYVWSEEQFVTWEALADEIPQRMKRWNARLSEGGR
ncbi:hypothetical protein MO973_43125 [Paenibacillus sp. TRM 82003]|nr:hypothetical protein [Paenibacillus sp. TRM 82003]